MSDSPSVWLWSTVTRWLTAASRHGGRRGRRGGGRGCGLGVGGRSDWTAFPMGLCTSVCTDGSPRWRACFRRDGITEAGGRAGAQVNRLYPIRQGEYQQWLKTVTHKGIFFLLLLLLLRLLLLLCAEAAAVKYSEKPRFRHTLKINQGLHKPRI